MIKEIFILKFGYNIFNLNQNFYKTYGLTKKYIFKNL